jgi:hypothetical protein
VPPIAAHAPKFPAADTLAKRYQLWLAHGQRFHNRDKVRFADNSSGEVHFESRLEILLAATLGITLVQRLDAHQHAVIVHVPNGNRVS